MTTRSLGHSQRPAMKSMPGHVPPAAVQAAPELGQVGGGAVGGLAADAAAGLLVLAAAAAAVSFAAQYRMVYGARRLAVAAGLEAAIPDAAALVFACLGIALACMAAGRSVPGLLNVAAVGTSVFMNTIAASPGWRSLAIWAMPPDRVCAGQRHRRSGSYVRGRSPATRH